MKNCNKLIFKDQLITGNPVVSWGFKTKDFLQSTSHHIPWNTFGFSLLGFAPSLLKRFLTNSFQKKGKGLEFDSKSFSRLIDTEIKHFNGMVRRNADRQLIGYLKLKLLGVGGHGKRSRCALLVVFVRKVLALHKSEGMKGLVLYLKTSYVLIQQAVAGYKVENLDPLKRRVRRSRTGLPLWIPAQQRVLLMNKDIPTIRFGTSLLSIYRILSFPAKVSIDSIIKEGNEEGLVGDKSDFEEVVRLFGYRNDLPSLLKKVKNFEFPPFSIAKSSPITSELPDLNTSSLLRLKGKSVVKAAISSSERSIGFSAHLLFNVFTDIFEYMQMFAADKKGFFEFFSSLQRLSVIPIKPSDYHKETLIGSLGLKDEPAGKVRVFAMVDCFTQGLLNPLHKLLQSLVRPLKEDATFDQVGVVDRKVAELMERGGKVRAYSYDLSSATDRLPIGIQVSILSPLLGIYESKSGAAILTGRDYKLPIRASRDVGVKSVRYAVGQPMGALSSGMMLAITHHIVVQGAALRCGKLGGKRWFDAYVVLGDDIVIFDRAVAKSYYNIMTKTLGVNIGLAKSIESRDGFTFEFAKKYGVDGKHAFVVPLRDCIVTCLSTECMVEFAYKHLQSFQNYLKMRGLGYKTRSKGMGNLGNLPSRLRHYLVFRAYYQMDFFEGITLKSLRENFFVTRTGMESLLQELILIRMEKVEQLEKMKTLTYEEVGQAMVKPFFRWSGLSKELDRIFELEAIKTSYRLMIKFVPPGLSPDDLRTLVHEILESIDRLDKYIEDAPKLSTSLLLQTRLEARPFNEQNKIYNLGVRLNRCFLTTQDGPIMGLDNATLDVEVDEKVEEPSSGSAPYLTAHFFEKYEPYMVIRYSLGVKLSIFALGLPLAILIEVVSGLEYTIPWDEYVNNTIYLGFSNESPSPELRYSSSYVHYGTSEVPRTTQPSYYYLAFACFLTVTLIFAVSFEIAFDKFM